MHNTGRPSINIDGIDPMSCPMEVLAISMKWWPVLGSFSTTCLWVLGARA